MSKVEMSLQEYNQMKEELDMYKEIVNAMTAPKMNYDIDRYKKDLNSTLYVNIGNLSLLSQKSMSFVEQKIMEGMENFMEFNDINGKTEYEFKEMYAFVNHYHSDEEVPQEDFFIPSNN